MKQCKAEIISPESDWDMIWSRVRLNSLDFQITSFSFKLLHNLLTTEERMAAILPNSSPLCKFSCHNTPATLQHTFFHCRLSAVTGSWLLAMVRASDPAANEEKVLRLDFDGDGGLVWVTATILHHIWESRVKSKECTIKECRAKLMSNLDFIKKTKHENIVVAALQHISL